jgi:hypothetical protein
MTTPRLSSLLTTGIVGLVIMTTVWAGNPVWTFALIPGYPSSVSLNSSETAAIQYTITNQSYKSHLLQMRPIPGIASSGCTSPLASLSSIV